MEFYFRKNIVFKIGSIFARINLWHIPSVLEKLELNVSDRILRLSQTVSSHEISSEDKKWLISFVKTIGTIGKLRPFLQTEYNRPIDSGCKIEDCEISINDEYPINGLGGFYRFYKLDPNFLNSLFLGNLKFSNPRSYNDPFEANYLNEKQQWVKLEESQINFSTCCFSAESENILMWSHYADSHRGIALEFDLKINLIVDSGVNKIPKLYPIMYFDDAPTYPPHYDSFICTSKSNSWAYEKEVRIVLPTIPPGFYEFNKSHLKSIILGCECKSEDIKVIKELLPLYKNAKLKQALRKNGCYELDIREI